MSHRHPTYEADNYRSGQVRLYGVPIAAKGRKLNLGGILIAQGPLARASAEKVELNAAIIFGYAYQGHCYDLPKPKVMLLGVPPAAIPKDDCGYADKPQYKVWVIDKLDECAEIDVNEGRVEQLVLDANMPGRRSPQTYRAEMQLAHRSGRLTE